MNFVSCAVAAVVTHRKQVLFGQRKTGHDGFQWQLPGGWIEQGESPLEAVHREVFEETGLRLCEPRFVGVTSNVFSTTDHSISICFEAACINSSALCLREANLVKSWHWKDWSQVQQNLFLPLQLLNQTGFQPFRSELHLGYISL